MPSVSLPRPLKTWRFSRATTAVRVPSFAWRPGVNIYGASSGSNPPPPFNVVQVVRDFQTPMNHAYNLTIEQQVSLKTAFSIAYVGTTGVIW